MDPTEPSKSKPIRRKRWSKRLDVKSKLLKAPVGPGLDVGDVGTKAEQSLTHVVLAELPPIPYVPGRTKLTPRFAAACEARVLTGADVRTAILASGLSSDAYEDWMHRADAGEPAHRIFFDRLESVHRAVAAAAMARILGEKHDWKAWSAWLKGNKLWEHGNVGTVRVGVVSAHGDKLAVVIE